MWYGMMQIPPADAVVPELGVTFGELRDKVIEATSSNNPDSEPVLSLACSRRLQARELLSTCSETQIYCWHRCYDFTDDLSPDACAAQNLGFNCTSQFDQVYLGGHGDFSPTCTNTTETVTPRPVVVQPTGECAEWDAALQDDTYHNVTALYEGETYLLWSVKNDVLEGKMITKGLVGWMAMGIENIGGNKNGMNGARVVMGRAIPGEMPTVEEYRIDEHNSAFRHWKTPLAPSALMDSSMVSSGCVSSMEFKTASIYNMALNLTAGSVNRFIWARTQQDYPTDEWGGYSGYHSDATRNRTLRSRFRGHFNISFDIAGMQEEGPTQGPEPDSAMHAALVAPLVAASVAAAILAVIS